MFPGNWTQAATPRRELNCQLAQHTGPWGLQEGSKPVRKRLRQGPWDFDQLQAPLSECSEINQHLRKHIDVLYQDRTGIAAIITAFLISEY